MKRPTDPRFLIADDFLTMRSTVRSLLRATGCDEAEGGEDGSVASAMRKAS